MIRLDLTNAQATALVIALDRLAAHAPEGARAIIVSDVLRTLFLQLKRQTKGRSTTAKRGDHGR